MKLVNVNADEMQVFLIINNVEIKINADVNVKTLIHADLELTKSHWVYHNKKYK